MLTREKARKQPCKPNDAITLLMISFMAAQYKDSELSESQKEDLDKIYGAELCTANDCPKWVDTEGEGTWMCPKHKDHIRVNRTDFTFEQALECARERGLEDCDDCPHRYGRCGG